MIVKDSPEVFVATYGTADEDKPIYFKTFESPYYKNEAELVRRLRNYIIAGTGPIVGLPGIRMAKMMRRRTLRWLKQMEEGPRKPVQRRPRIRLDSKYWYLSVKAETVLCKFKMIDDCRVMTVDDKPVKSVRTWIYKGHCSETWKDSKVICTPSAFVAWIFHYAQKPKYPIYHINGDRDDCRRENLVMAYPGTPLPPCISYVEPWAKKPWKLTVEGCYTGTFATLDGAIAEYALC